MGVKIFLSFRRSKERERERECICVEVFNICFIYCGTHFPSEKHVNFDNRWICSRNRTRRGSLNIQALRLCINSFHYSVTKHCFWCFHSSPVTKLSPTALHFATHPCTSLSCIIGSSIVTFSDITTFQGRPLLSCDFRTSFAFHPIFQNLNHTNSFCCFSRFKYRVLFKCFSSSLYTMLLNIITRFLDKINLNKFDYKLN